LGLKAGNEFKVHASVSFIASLTSPEESSKEIHEHFINAVSNGAFKELEPQSRSV